MPNGHYILICLLPLLFGILVLVSSDEASTIVHINLGNTNVLVSNGSTKYSLQLDQQTLELRFCAFSTYACYTGDKHHCETVANGTASNYYVGEDKIIKSSWISAFGIHAPAPAFILLAAIMAFCKLDWAGTAAVSTLLFVATVTTVAALITDLIIIKTKMVRLEGVLTTKLGIGFWFNVVSLAFLVLAGIYIYCRTGPRRLNKNKNDDTTVDTSINTGTNGNSDIEMDNRDQKESPLI